MSKTATFVSEYSGIVVSSGSGSHKVVYRLDPPLDGGVHYVVSSAVDYAFDTGEAETMVFAADEEGEVTNWTHLAVVQGQMNHEEAMARLGYTISDEEGSAA